MVHISAPRTQVHSNIHERLFTGDRKRSVTSALSVFSHSTWKNFFFLFHLCFSQSIWKNANCQSGLGRFRQSVPPAESPGEQTNAVIHYSPGPKLFWVAQRFNFQWKVELGKLTICKEGQTHGSWRPVKWKKISIIFFQAMCREDGHLVQYVLTWPTLFWMT